MASAKSGAAGDRRPRPARRGGRTSPAHRAGGGAGRSERDSVAVLQRSRMLAAMAAACAEQGVAPVTVSEICSRSRISRRTFYEMFTDREECFLATLQEAIDRAAALVLPAWNGQERWLDRLRAGLLAFLRFLDEQPTFGRVAIVSSLAAGPAALQRRAAVLAHAIAAIDEGRRQPRAPASLTRTAAEGALGGVLAILHTRITIGEPPTAGRTGRKPRPPARMTELTGELMSILATPYLGAAAAQRERSRALPQARARHRPDSDPLARLKMRLTYRTIRVLHAIAEQPDRAGLSNRQVAEAAEITDPGQASKLLHRLQHTGLIHNRQPANSHAAANAWRLTETGAAVIAAIGEEAARP